MSLYSGTSDNSIGQFIAKVMTKQDIYDILTKLYEPQIGTIKLFYNCQKPVNQIDDLLDKNIIEKYYSDGWVYPNGSIISKQFFPRMYELLKCSEYDGKNDMDNGITLPTIDNFFKLNPNKIQNPFISENFVKQINELPNHKHDFEYDTESNETIGIENATILYTTKGTTSDTTLQQKYDSITKKSYPCFHAGNASKISKCTKCEWSVEIDVDSNFVAATIDCNTADVFQKDDICIEKKICPKHMQIPCLIYIGKPNI